MMTGQERLKRLTQHRDAWKAKRRSFMLARLEKLFAGILATLRGLPEDEIDSAMLEVKPLRSIGSIKPASKPGKVSAIDKLGL